MLIALCIGASLNTKLNTHQICSHEMGPFGLTHCWSKDRSNWVIKVKGAFIEYTANMSVMFREERQKSATAYSLGLQWSICLSVVSDPYFTPDRKNVIALACQHTKIKSQGYRQNTGEKLKYCTNLRSSIPFYALLYFFSAVQSLDSYSYELFCRLRIHCTYKTYDHLINYDAKYKINS